ncbi:response regulator [Candidatus Magnetaquicoccus inordinatus]|uniref:response regulator n=1 Tax=Candidatus Magnetaquicoccus inordinatus TaxID=2496818 RepID=UPI00102C441E|nr:response regulator [Candidatus Magnetaquicoccus inordinatus]
MLEDWPSNQLRDTFLQQVALIQTQLQRLHDLNPSPTLQPHLQQIQMANETLSALLNSVVAATPTLLPAAGSHFLPYHNQEHKTTAPPLREESATPPLHILLVEDNPFTQKLMCRLLSLRAHRISVANQGEEALALLQNAATQKDQRFDIILMDIRMPGMDGFATTEAIREWEKRQQQPSVPIIAVTVLNEESDRQRAMQVGMDGFHPKPVQANLLFAEMEQLLAKRNRPSPDPVESATPDPTSENTTPLPPVDVGLNMDLLLKTVENDWSLLGEIVDLYRQDAPKQLQRIWKGIQQQDHDLVREAAHSLKGASGAFGKATLAYALAFQLEQAGRIKDLTQADAIFEQLRQSIHLLEQALDTELHKHSSL